VSASTYTDEQIYRGIPRRRIDELNESLRACIPRYRVELTSTERRHTGEQADAGECPQAR
jgi:hypothetical protein